MLVRMLRRFRGVILSITRNQLSRSALPCGRHSRASLHGENPNRILNDEVRSQFFALQIQLGRQSGLNSPLVCPAKHPVWFERQTRDAARAHRSMLDALAVLASECIACFCFTEPELQRGVESESQPQSC